MESHASIDWLIAFWDKSMGRDCGVCKYLASCVGKDDYGLSLQFNSDNY